MAAAASENLGLDSVSDPRMISSMILLLGNNNWVKISSLWSNQITTWPALQDGGLVRLTFGLALVFQTKRMCSENRRSPYWINKCQYNLLKSLISDCSRWDFCHWSLLIVCRIRLTSGIRCIPMKKSSSGPVITLKSSSKKSKIFCKPLKVSHSGIKRNFLCATVPESHCRDDDNVVDHDGQYVLQC